MNSTYKSKANRVTAVVAIWAATSLFFAAVIRVSDIFAGHKPLWFLLYANGVHFALWGLTFPLLSKCTAAFPLNTQQKVRNAAVRALLAGLIGTFMAVVFPVQGYISHFSILTHNRFNPGAAG